jgi:hypothetical protein
MLVIAAGCTIGVAIVHAAAKGASERPQLRRLTDAIRRDVIAAANIIIESCIQDLDKNEGDKLASLINIISLSFYHDELSP